MPSTDRQPANRRRLAAFHLNTTLVLDHERADFSTDATNSALILETKSPRPRRSTGMRYDGEQKRRTIWLSREREPYATEKSVSTRIRSCYRAVIGSADHRTLCSRRPRGRQTID